MTDLHVDLATFSGPLDLLLHLVQEEEVDIHAVSLARIAGTFLETVRQQVGTLDVDRAGEFLVVASQLLVLKSRALLPRDTPFDDDDLDPRLDLVKQLLEYRRFKGAAKDLSERAEREQDHLAVRVTPPGIEVQADAPIEADLYSLVAAFQRLLRETGADTAVAMPRERLPITHFVERIFDRLVASGGSIRFASLIGERPDRTYVIGAFLALLELIKLRKVVAEQDGLGEIAIRVRPEALDPATSTADAAARALDEVEAAPVAIGPRIVFMGSPEFAVPALHSLVGAGHPPVLVVTPPPQPAGRGRRVAAAPLAREAEGLGLPLHRTQDVNSRSSRDAIAAATPEVIVTAAFGQKLGPGVLGLPPRGCLNLHTSLLPRYRGASPVATALRDGVTETGVTLFVMDEELDHGPVLASATLPLEGHETADEVTARLATLGADLLVRTLPEYLAGNLVPQPQDHAAATAAGRLAKEDGLVRFDRPAEVVKNHVRAVTSWPGAQASWQPRVRHEPLPLVLLKTAVLDADRVAADPQGAPVAPGTVLAAGAEGIDVACAPGVLRVLALKPAGGRAMDAKTFLNGHRIVAGDRLV
jgi:methionyl-tRNA formyltransferase